MPGKRVQLEKILRYAGLLLCFALGFLAGLGGTVMAAPQEGAGSNFALRFDGLDDRVDLSAAALGQPTSVTVEAWVRIDEPNKVHYLVTNADSDFNDGFSLIVDQSGRVTFAAASALYVKGIAVSATQLEVGQWHHVAGVYDAQGGAVKVYVDGVEEGVVAYSGGVRYLSGRGLKFGTQNKSYNRVGRYLRGALDEVRIWEAARDPDGILANMEAEISGEDQDLKGYWQLNEGTGLSAADVVSGSNSGQLKMGPEWIEAGWRAVAEGQQIAIDIKPGGSHNVVLLSRRNIPVAVLSSPDLDVLSQIDHKSLTFGRTGTEKSLEVSRRGRPMCNRRDVNYDGLRDLVCRFNIEKAQFQGDETEGILRAMTTEQVQLMGSDEIVVRGHSLTNRDDNRYGDKFGGGDDQSSGKYESRRSRE